MVCNAFHIQNGVYSVLARHRKNDGVTHILKKKPYVFYVAFN